MGEEIAFETGRIPDFQGLLTFTMTLDRVILHTVMHHSSTSTYTPNFIEIEEIFFWTDGRTFDFETYFIYRSTWRSRPNNSCWCYECVSKSGLVMSRNEHTWVYILHCWIVYVNPFNTRQVSLAVSWSVRLTLLVLVIIAAGLCVGCYSVNVSDIGVSYHQLLHAVNVVISSTVTTRCHCGDIINRCRSMLLRGLAQLQSVMSVLSDVSNSRLSSAQLQQLHSALHW